MNPHGRPKDLLSPPPPGCCNLSQTAQKAPREPSECSPRLCRSQLPSVKLPSGILPVYCQFERIDFSIWGRMYSQCISNLFSICGLIKTLYIYVCLPLIYCDGTDLFGVFENVAGSQPFRRLVSSDWKIGITCMHFPPSNKNQQQTGIRRSLNESPRFEHLKWSEAFVPSV